MTREAPRELSGSESRLLAGMGWAEFVGTGRGVWVCVSVQRLLVAGGGRVTHGYACSTAKAGLGGRKDSRKTPRGWHEVAGKAGTDLPAGAILDGREWTGEVWTPGSETTSDLVLSRVLRLTGLEPGRNRGGDVDTWERLIYIHGTNAEALLGVPSSQGCIRLSNADVIELYDLVPLGTRVLITP